VKVQSIRRLFHALLKRGTNRASFSEIRVMPLIGAVAAFILILLMLTQVTSLFWTSRTISSFGSVKAIGVGIYWDSALTNPVSSVDWGLIEPGSNSATTFYVRNEGNSPVTLALNTSNWSPSAAANYLTLGWNYDERVIEVAGVCQTILTLSTSPNISGISGFSFDIVIAGIG